MIDYVASRIADADAITRSRQFPYPFLAAYGYGYRGSTGVMAEWQKFVTNARRHGITDPKLVCIDIQPYGSSQAPERDDILNIGGFKALQAADLTEPG
jgi:hypothetical protein